MPIPYVQAQTYTRTRMLNRTPWSQVGDNYDADMAGAINAQLLSTVWVRSEQPSLTQQTDTPAQLPLGKPQPAFTVASVLELEPIIREIG